MPDSQKQNNIRIYIYYQTGGFPRTREAEGGRIRQMTDGSGDRSIK